MDKVSLSHILNADLTGPTNATGVGTIGATGNTGVIGSAVTINNLTTIVEFPQIVTPSAAFI